MPDRSSSMTSTRCRRRTPPGCCRFKARLAPKRPSGSDVAEVRHRSNEPNDAAPLKYVQRMNMPLFRSDDIRIAALSGALLVAALAPSLACATLGEPESTVQSD